MRTIKTRRVEHFKIADFSFIELEHEVIEDNVADKDTKRVQEELEAAVTEYFTSTRKIFKKMMSKGEFDLV